MEHCSLVFWFFFFFCNHCIYLFCFFASLQWPTYLTSVLKNRLFRFFWGLQRHPTIDRVLHGAAFERETQRRGSVQFELLLQEWALIQLTGRDACTFLAPPSPDAHPGIVLSCPQVTGVRKGNEASRVWDYREIQDTWGHQVSPEGCMKKVLGHSVPTGTIVVSQEFFTRLFLS